MEGLLAYTAIAFVFMVLAASQEGEARFQQNGMDVFAFVSCALWPLIFAMMIGFALHALGRKLST